MKSVLNMVILCISLDEHVPGENIRVREATEGDPSIMWAATIGIHLDETVSDKCEAVDATRAKEGVEELTVRERLGLTQLP